MGGPSLAVTNNGHTPAATMVPPTTRTPHPTLQTVHLHSQLLDGLVKTVQLLLAVPQVLRVSLHGHLCLFTLGVGAAQ